MIVSQIVAVGGVQEMFCLMPQVTVCVSQGIPTQPNRNRFLLDSCFAAFVAPYCPSNSRTVSQGAEEGMENWRELVKNGRAKEASKMSTARNP